MFAGEKRTSAIVSRRSRFATLYLVTVDSAISNLFLSLPICGQNVRFVIFEVLICVVHWKFRAAGNANIRVEVAVVPYNSFAFWAKANCGLFGTHRGLPPLQRGSLFVVLSRFGLFIHRQFCAADRAFILSLLPVIVQNSPAFWTSLNSRELSQTFGSVQKVLPPCI